MRKKERKKKHIDNDVIGVVDVVVKKSIATSPSLSDDVGRKTAIFFLKLNH